MILLEHCLQRMHDSLIPLRTDYLFDEQMVCYSKVVLLCNVRQQLGLLVASELRRPAGV